MDVLQEPRHIVYTRTALEKRKENGEREGERGGGKEGERERKREI